MSGLRISSADFGRKGMTYMKLLLLAYAGSLGNAYRQWFEDSELKMELISLEYPGKGHRMSEPLASSWEALIADTAQQISTQIQVGEDYLLFGHSMGAKVAFDTCLELERQGLTKPVLTVFSGSTPFNEEMVLNLADRAVFRQDMLALGGIPTEVLADPELAEYIFELLHQDATLLSAFEYQGQGITGACAIFSGKEDQPASRQSWQLLAKGDFSVEEFEGGHFFIFEQQQVVLEKLEALVQMVESAQKMTRG